MTRERDVARGALAGPGNIMGTPQHALHEAVHDLTAHDRRLAAQSALRVRPAKESVELAAYPGHFDGKGAVRGRRGERSVARAGGPESKQEPGHGDSIVVVAIGGVDREIIEQLKNGVSRVFKKQVASGKQLPEPDDAFNKKRRQYMSSAIVDALAEEQQYAEYERLLGVVDHDLYVPELNFVFGEARNRVAVISLTRLRQEFYGRPENRSLFHRRALTEAVHELGHTYGLGHCRDSQCVMFFSDAIEDTDTKNPDFCPRCQSKLR